MAIIFKEWTIYNSQGNFKAEAGINDDANKKAILRLSEEGVENQYWDIETEEYSLIELRGNLLIYQVFENEFLVYDNHLHYLCHYRLDREEDSSNQIHNVFRSNETYLVSSPFSTCIIGDNVLVSWSAPSNRLHVYSFNLRGYLDIIIGDAISKVFRVLCHDFKNDIKVEIDEHQHSTIVFSYQRFKAVYKIPENGWIEDMTASLVEYYIGEDVTTRYQLVTVSFERSLELFQEYLTCTINDETMPENFHNFLQESGWTWFAVK